jgi:hypothetical protein
MNIFIGDANFCYFREIHNENVLTIVAGRGNCGYFFLSLFSIKLYCIYTIERVLTEKGAM